MAFFRKLDDGERALKDSFLEDERSKARARFEESKIDRLQSQARREAEFEFMPRSERFRERAKDLRSSRFFRGIAFVAEGLRRAGRNLGARSREASLRGFDSSSRLRSGVGGSLGRELDNAPGVGRGLFSELKK